jgi:predicted nucleic acid-binding protein
VNYLVDSDRVADYLNGYRLSIALLDSLAPQGLAISAGEIEEGIFYGRDRQRKQRGFRDFLRGVDILPVNRSIMHQFATIRGQLRRQGNLIGDMDLIIADVPLVTRNIRHFERIDGLKLYS